jgi:uncharacterized protein
MNPGLTLLKDKYMICQATRVKSIPLLANSTDFFSYTVTAEEVSIVCRQNNDYIPETQKVALNRRIIKVNGPFELNVTGIIAGISGLLAKNNIPLFTISTFNTDYLVLHEDHLQKALSLFRLNGYEVCI